MTTNFKTMSLEEQLAAQQKMMAQAKELGMELSPALTEAFNQVDVGASTLKSLEKTIATFEAGIDHGKQPETDGGETGGADTAPAKPAKKARKPLAEKTAPAKGADTTAPAKRAAPKKPAADKKSTAKPEEAPVAKKAKKAKTTAKKSPAKKAKKTASTKERKARTSFADDAKITVITKENPARKGTGRFERLGKVLSAGGKTVAAYVKGGGRVSTLGRAVQMKLVKVG